MVDFVPPNEITGALTKLSEQGGTGSGGVTDPASLSAPLNIFTGTMEIQGGLVVVGLIGTASQFVMAAPPQLPNYTVDGLNSAFPPGGSNEGNIAYVTDAVTPTWRATLVGGGGEVCLAFSTGAAWVAV